ncbi:MAG: type II secretion system protein GspJ [Thermodesulfovibrionales bacterium]|nr:type II secretion system protein GspJ [Thermodesulfovibrionales bacterium]
MNSKGLTLLEVLIAVAISSIIIITLYATLSSSIMVMSDSDKYLSSYREVSIVVDAMRREIESTVFNAQDEYMTFALIQKDYFGRPQGDIRFVGMNATSVGLFVIHYRADEIDKRLRLLKRVYPVWSSPEKARWETVLDEIYSFSVLAYEGQEGLKIWDSNSRKTLPREIRIELQVKTGEGQVVSVSDRAVLRTNRPL